MTSPTYLNDLAAKGVRLSPSLNVRFTPHSGYHIVAVEGISVGALLAAAPLSACADLSPDGLPAAELARLGLPPLCISALLLQRELLPGYCSVLPPAHIALLRALQLPFNVLLFDAEARAALAGTSLQNSSMHLHERYDDIVLPFLRGVSSDSSFASCATALLGEGFDGFLRSAALVMSRCFHADGSENAASPSVVSRAFSVAGAAAAAAGDLAATRPSVSDSSPVLAIGSGPILAPLLDLFNHDTHSPCTHNARVGGEFHLYALRPIEAGDQVFLSYGELSDSQLLHTYGYVPEPDLMVAGLPSRNINPAPLLGNPHNCVHVSAAAVVSPVRCFLASLGESDSARMKVFNSAAALLRRLGLLPDAGFELSTPAASADMDPAAFLRAAVPATLLTCIQVFLLDAPALVDYKLAAAEANQSGHQLVLPVPRSAAEKRAASSAPRNGEDGVSSDDESRSDASDESDADDAAETWAALLAVLKARSACYPSSLAEDRSWYNAVCESLRSGGTEALNDTGESTVTATKRVRLTSAASPPSALCTRSSSVTSCLRERAPETESLIQAAVSNTPLRYCRLIAMREKELLDSLVRAVKVELQAASI